MSFWSNLFKSSLEKWIENASDNELDNGYEKRRQNGQRLVLVETVRKHMK